MKKLQQRATVAAAVAQLAASMAKLQGVGVLG